MVKVTKEELVNDIKRSGYEETSTDVFIHKELKSFKIVIEGDVIKFFTDDIEKLYLRKNISDLIHMTMDWKGNLEPL